MELFVYRGLSTVPSIDFSCLRTMAYLKSCEAPVAIRTVNANPYLSPSGKLPYLRLASGLTISGHEQIVDYLKDGKLLKSHDNVGQYSRRSVEALSEAYICYLRNQLEPCLQYFLWGDPLNAEQTRLMYAKRTQFPFSFYYPNRYIKSVDLLMQTLKHFSIEDKLENHETQAMIVDAMKMLNQLEAKLGTKRFLLGQPTELDATVYAYLAVIRFVLPRGNVLQSHLAACNGLVAFVNDFQARILSDIPLGKMDAAEQQRLLGHTVSTDIDNEHSAWISKLLAAGIAVAAMSLFAIKQGLFSPSDDSMFDMQYTEDDDDEDGGDD